MSTGYNKLFTKPVRSCWLCPGSHSTFQDDQTIWHKDCELLQKEVCPCPDDLLIHPDCPLKDYQPNNDPKTLPDAVNAFFALLDTIEESSSTGREFHPTTINSCRVMHTEKLNKLLPLMKQLAQQPREDNHDD